MAVGAERTPHRPGHRMAQKDGRLEQNSKPVAPPVVDAASSTTPMCEAVP